MCKNNSININDLTICPVDIINDKSSEVDINKDIKSNKDDIKSKNMILNLIKSI